MQYQYRITVSYPDKTHATHCVTEPTILRALRSVSPDETFRHYVSRIYIDSKGWVYAVNKRERVTQ